MLLLTGEKLSKTYLERTLLDETSFSVEGGDKIGIVGRNGTGKTTLLRLLAGEEDLDGGSITKASGLRIGYLPQNPALDPEQSVLQQAQGAALGETKEYECKTILTKLGLFDFDAKIKTLSGGQKKRVALASALVHELDLLILDEPTNHVDNEMVTWLEDFLASYQGALLMVTHDRYFLERVCNRIVELDRGKLYSYPCHYARFLEKKAEREEMTLASERKRQSLIRREVAWILQGPCARGTKSQYRIDRLQQLQSQSVDLSKSSVELRSVSSRLGKKIIELSGIGKSFGERQLFQNFSYLLLRDDRIGIIGPNGVGKSTLLKIIMGELSPDTGEVVRGDTVKIAYFSQEGEEFDLSQRAIDYVKSESNAIETPDGTLTAAQLLETFLFTPDLQYTTISRLSGGERRRLQLLKALMSAPNILILDEPTNDLDIETLTVLEDYLEGFPGAVILVSHDRYFLDKTATRIFSFEDGEIKGYMGGYTDWSIQREAALAKAAPAPKLEPEKSRAARSKDVRVKFSFKEQREFESIDADIAALEAALAQTEEALQQSAHDFVALQAQLLQKESLEAQLEEKMERWVYLQELSEKIAAQKAQR